MPAEIAEVRAVIARVADFILAAAVSIMLAAPVCAQTGRPMDAGPRAPELEPNDGWLNTDRPLRFDGDLKGQVVLLDFWTYCCINCMHVLPDLHYLEQKFKDEPFVVIGVHSAKFENEADRRTIRAAIQRYEIEHPVVVDRDMEIWQRYGVRAWPTVVLVGSDGRIVGQASGEGNRELLERVIGQALAEGRRKGTLAAAPPAITLDAEIPSASGLAFPGKVLGDFERRRVFISDSTHHRVIAATWPDESGASDVLAVFGGAEQGFKDGDAQEARFFEPQGLALSKDGQTLYVADRQNHAIRAIDLETRWVETISGNGQQGYDRRGGAAGQVQGLNSPWALELAPDDRTLYIAMAGNHQLWTLDLETRVAKNFVGTGGENILDGPADQSLLAQPSGLALLDGSLYFADSEVSAIRGVDLNTGEVRTVIGTGLFDFGDIDGEYPRARLQHPLGVAAFGDALLVADTYNHKVKLVDPRARTSRAWLGTGTIAGGDADALSLFEPGGLSFAGEGDAARLFIADTNNHRVVIVDPATKAWREMRLRGLSGGKRDAAPVDTEATAHVAVAQGQQATLLLHPALPQDGHPNPDAPISIMVSRDGMPVAQRTLRTDALPITIDLPADAAAPGTLTVELRLAYCTEGDRALCAPYSVRWTVEVAAGESREATLTAEAPAAR